MDRILAKRLESDDEFRQKIVKLTKDYLQLAKNSVDYWADEFDVAHDILMCYAPLNRQDLENLEKGHPKRFVLPMTSTQITTMATFISQVLFGDEQPHKVDGRGPEDEVSAEHMNQLLRWNAEQQPSYLLGYLWVQDSLTYNRAVFYNSWEPIFDLKIQAVEVEMPEELDEAGKPVKYSKPQRVKIPAGGYVKYHLVSPYEFFSDPAVPLWRLQDGRFAGHRTLISWQELKRRSELPVDEPAYVLPKAVADLKERKKGKGSNTSPAPVPSSTGGTRNTVMSRTAYERSRSDNFPAGEADANDPGMIETHVMWIRLVPADNEIDDNEESVIFQVLLGNQEVVLSIGESTYQHDMFPYSAGEARPSGYYQFSPGWVMHMKALQDYVDYYKNRRQQAISRTIGNIFIARTDQVNIDDFLDPDKEGLVIPVLDTAANSKLDDIIKQVPINDTTQSFHEEMKDFISFAETVTGVNSQMQGQMDDGTPPSATEFSKTVQMGAGRLSSIARLLSVQGLVPQTRQIVANFQQFLDGPMSVRFVPSGLDSPSLLQGARALQITPDVIQGRFDYIAHDGAMPGTDTRKVAAISRLLEAAGIFPQYFTPAPGNIDARALILSAAKAAGLSVENFQFQQGAAPPPGQNGTLPNLNEVGPAVASQFPESQFPAVMSRGAGRPSLPNVEDVPSAAPPQIRPNQL